MTARSKISLALLAFAAALVLAPLAAAHVELSPEEAESGSSQRFVMAVENEEPAESIVKVVTQFPESVVTARFVQAPGWTRTVTTKPLDTPVVGPDGEEITERIDTVTWEGDAAQPGDDAEFTLTFAIPEQPGATIFFPTLVTYSNGDVVRWIGSPGSEEPAPGVLITEAAGGGGGSTTEQVTTTVATTVTTEAESTTEPDTTDTIAPVPVSDDDDGSSWPLYLGLLALLAAIAGLAYWLYRRNKDEEPPIEDGGPGAGPPPIDPAAPRGSSSMPGGGQAPEPPGETEVIDPGSQPTQRIDPADAQETQRIDPDDWQQR